MRKKNRNYKIFKKYETSYKKLVNSINPRPETVTCYLNRQNKAYEKARQSANDSSKANRRVKLAYGNTVNSVMTNPSISAKKIFSMKMLTSSLDFRPQVNDVCLRANRKLSVLRSVNILHRQTLDLLYKLTVRSVIDYALPVYYKCLTQIQVGRLENIQYRAGKIVTGALHFTSKNKLNSELGWESIMDRGDLLSLNIFHKIHRHETRPLIKSCMPKPDIGKIILHVQKGVTYLLNMRTRISTLPSSLTPQNFGITCQKKYKFKTFKSLKIQSKLLKSQHGINTFLVAANWEINS